MISTFEIHVDDWRDMIARVNDQYINNEAKKKYNKTQQAAEESKSHGLKRGGASATKSKNNSQHKETSSNILSCSLYGVSSGADECDNSSDSSDAESDDLHHKSDLYIHPYYAYDKSEYLESLSDLYQRTPSKSLESDFAAANDTNQ